MSQYAKEIKHILATLNEQGDEDDASLPDEEELDTIHVYPVEGGGLLLTRTPLEDEQAAPPPVIESRDDSLTGRHPAKTPPPFVLFLLLLCVFVLGDLADTQLIALLIPTVTVTIVPQTHTVTTTANLPAAAIRAYNFAPLTLSLSQMAPATGTGHQDARQATGTVTFYNGLFTPQFIAQGTMFTDNDGVKIATTQPADIPAGNPTTGYGTVTVAAQAIQTGAAGNIAAGDITVTINNGLLVKNGPFRRGQDARTFAVVTKEDIQQVVTQLTPRLHQSEQAALTSQLQANEALFSPTCTPTMSTDHQPGDEATHVTITMAETCAAAAYNQQSVQAQGELLLNEQARTLSKGYRLVGDIHPTILAKQAAASIRVQFTGTYLYQINQQALITLIAGQPKQHALFLLAGIRGIQHITITGIADDNALPIDTTHIHIMLLYVVS
jgi:Baseplate J-like protein